MVILFIFLFSIISGFARGLISEVISLLTLIAAFVVAGLFAEPVAAFFTHASPVSAPASTGVDATQVVSYVAVAITFVLLFILTSIAGAVIKYLINMVFRAGVLGFANRLLGMVFGVARGFLLNVFLIFIVQLTPVSARAEWQASHYVPLFAPYVSYLSSKVSPTLAELKDKYSAALGDAASNIENATQKH
jgi:membrane protein required for colicin V production